MPDSSFKAPPSLLTVLRIADVRRLWIGQLVSILGDFLAIFAIFSVISFRMHGTPTNVSLVLVAYLLPFTFISPIAGVFVDRWDLKRTLIASDVLRAVLTAFLPFAAGIWQIYAIVFAISVVSTFFSSAHSVTVRTIAPKEALISVNALMQQAFYVMQILGPAAAGVLVASLGPWSCFWLDTASFLLSAWMISRVAIYRESTSVRGLSSFIPEMRAGIRFIGSHRTVLLVVMATSAGMFAMRSFGALLSVYVRDVLKGGAESFGVLSSLIGAGMIVGNMAVHRVGRAASRAKVVLAGVFGTGLSIGLMAAIPVWAVAVLGIVVMGSCFAFLVVPSQTLVQEETPPDLLGRVFGSMTAVLMGSQVVGLSIAGPVAQTIGIRNLYFASALLLAFTAAAGSYDLRRTRLRQPQD